LLLQTGRIVRIFGRLSIREDDDTKIVAGVIETCPTTDKNETVSLSKGVTYKDASHTNIKTKSTKKKCVFLRFPSSTCQELIDVNKLLKIFDGNTTVSFYFSDKKEYIKQPGTSCIDVNDVLLKQLNSILGKENVVLQD
jgi:hypothetical protein